MSDSQVGLGVLTPIIYLGIVRAKRYIHLSLLF